MIDTLRTGIDIIEVERITRMKTGIRERFIERIYTDAEQEICGGHDQRLAGRFACKEAVAKVLGIGFGIVHMTDIEILNDDSGAPILILHGEAENEAARQHLTQWSVSISHLKEYAAAVAVAAG